MHEEGSNLYQQTQSKITSYGFSFQKYIHISMPKHYCEYVRTYMVHLQLPCLKEHVFTHCMLCPVEIWPNRLLCYCVCPQVARCPKIFYLDLAYSADCSGFFSEHKSKNPTCCFSNCQEWCSLWMHFPHSPHSLVSGAKNYFAVICS